jgi:hypothetical protein
VESLLKILAARNDGFRVIMSGVRAEGVSEDDEPPAEQRMIGGLRIRVTDSSPLRSTSTWSNGCRRLGAAGDTGHHPLFAGERPVTLPA